MKKRAQNMKISAVKRKSKRVLRTKKKKKKKMFCPEKKERTTHYHGPVDLSCCLPLKPFLLSCKLINSFKKMRINFIKNDSLNFRCHKEGLHFKMKIFTMIEGELSYLKISQIQGTKSEYNKILIKIFSHFKN